MTDLMAFDWRSFLLRWSEEWADSLREDEGRGEADAEARRARWLGFPPASEERIAAMEARLGRCMPPSYREFLVVTDGWRHAGGFVRLLAGTETARWHDNASGLADMFEGYLDEETDPEERREAGLWRRGLQLDIASDATYVLLDPEDVGKDGEWAVYTWSSWLGESPRRHANFLEFMRSTYREFHSLRAHWSPGEPAFVNETTRTLDAVVERARLEALSGGWERAVQALDEAVAYNRPRAAALGDQIRSLLGQTSMVRFEGLVTDPRYAPELLPPLVAPRARRHRDDSTLTYDVQGADDAVVSLAHATLARLRDGTYRYTAAGAFGEAVQHARELARWGDSDGAWRTLMDALPLWEPLGPDHLVPLGWVADPLLGPLLTQERGRELLSTPRAGQVGDAPEPAVGLDRGDLAWLAEPDPGTMRTSYRFVLVEGAEPQELPGRLTDGDEAALNGPMTLWEAQRGCRRDQREFSSFDDRALVAVGRAGGGWSFAFDGEPASFGHGRFVSPAAAASSAGKRAVVVWSGLRAGHGEPFFHLSVARDGVEQYAFTYAGGEVRSSGRIPRALAPSGFFRGRQHASEAERPLLEAVTGEFGVHLPRHSLVHGRLHTFVTRSWTRPPREGETHMVVRVELGDMSQRQAGTDHPA